MGEEWEQDWGVGKELGKKNRELVKMEKRLMAEAAETRALPSACPGYIFFQPLNAGAARKVGAGDTGTVGAHLRVTSGRLRSREHSSALTPNPDPPRPGTPAVGRAPPPSCSTMGQSRNYTPRAPRNPWDPNQQVQELCLSSAWGFPHSLGFVGPGLAPALGPPGWELSLWIDPGATGPGW